MMDMADTVPRRQNSYVRSPIGDEVYLTPATKGESPSENYLALEDDHNVYAEPADVCLKRPSLPKPPGPSGHPLGLPPPPHIPPIEPERFFPSRLGEILRARFHVLLLVGVGVVVVTMCAVILAEQRSLAETVQQHHDGAEKAVAEPALQVQEMYNGTQRSVARNTAVDSPGPVVCTMTMGTSGGDPFTDLPLYTSNGRMTGLDVKMDPNDGLLTGFRASYGGQKTDWRGFYNGRREHVSLRENEVFTGMAVYVGLHQDGLHGLMGMSLLTNLNRQTIVYGGRMLETVSGTGIGAHSAQVRADLEWDELLYFSGSAGAMVDTLQIHALGCRSTRFTVN